MKIIDGDKFQKEYVKQEKKNSITEIVIGSLLIILGLVGLILKQNILYTIIGIVVPVILLIYAYENYIHYKEYKTIATVKMILYVTLALVIAINPALIPTLGIKLFGAYLVFRSIFRMLLLSKYLSEINTIDLVNLILGILILILILSSVIFSFINIIILITCIIIGINLIVKNIKKEEK
jgi:hypothetical protein